jgi:5-methylcytosine-specific restriction enzyme subunit McrC
MNSEGLLVLELDEFTSIPCPPLSQAQLGLLRDRFGQFLDVSRQWDGTVELTAKHYVGVIALDGLRIHIHPKVPLDNLFYMLTYAYDLPEFRAEDAELSTADDLFDFIVEIFVGQVNRLLRRGIHRAYVDREENERYLRGRLLMAQHLRHNIIVVDRIYQSRNDYTADVLENQILQQTLSLLSRQSYVNQTLRSQVRQTFGAFDLVQPRTVQVSDCDLIHFTRLNERYRSPINLARLLLQHLSLEGRHGEHHFHAFLFDMNQLFEKFVARYLQRAFEGMPFLQLEVQPTMWLDSERQEKGRPDLWLRNGRGIHLILDTKYKHFGGTPQEADRNQMVTYCHALNAERGMLIYASPDSVVYRADIRGIGIYAASLPLDGSRQHLQASCDRLVASAKMLAEKVG